MLTERPTYERHMYDMATCTKYNHKSSFKFGSVTDYNIAEQVGPAAMAKEYFYECHTGKLQSLLKPPGLLGI